MIEYKTGYSSAGFGRRDSNRACIRVLLLGIYLFLFIINVPCYRSRDDAISTKYNIKKLGRLSKFGRVKGILRVLKLDTKVIKFIRPKVFKIHKNSVNLQS
jgi:hypothetical protein